MTSFVKQFGKTAAVAAVAVAATFATPSPAEADCKLECNNGESRLITKLRKSSRTGEQCVDSARFWAEKGGNLAAMMNRAGRCNITINCGDGAQVVGYTTGQRVSSGSRLVPGC